MESVDLVLTDVEGEAAADSLLASLSNIAFAVPRTPVKTKSKRKSKFFFRLKSLSEEVQERAEQFTPKVMEHIDAAVEGRLKDYKKELPPELSTHIDRVREFFLTELGPKTLAGVAGAAQAKDIVQKMLGTEVDPGTFVRYERMMNTAVNVSMARFIVDYLGLPKKVASHLISELQPKPIILPVPEGPRHGNDPRAKKGTPNV
jgi:hypothetical protein